MAGIAPAYSASARLVLYAGGKQEGEMRSTDYAVELAHADQGGARIERLRIKATDVEEIRFSWWKDGRFQTRPLDLEEGELLPLIAEAIDKGVFSEDFLRGLKTMLNGHLGDGSTQ